MPSPNPRGYVVTNVIKPIAALGDVVENKTLSKDLTKDVNVIITEGPENILDRDPNYKVENDTHIAKNNIHTNISFVGLLERHDRPHMSKCLRSANMRLERTLRNADSSHIRLIYVSSLARYDHTRRGLHF
jgi:hypothetical protein